MSESYSPPVVPGGYGEPPPVPVVNVAETSGTTLQETSGQDVKDVAKEQVAGVGQGAAQAGQHVAGVAKEQATQVTAEAGQQAKELLNQAQGQVKQQAGAQQEKLVSGLRSLSDELGGMAQNNEKPGLASDLARQAADRTGALAGWLDGREPMAILNDVSDFARRRPGTFLAIAAGIGFVGGRLTRGLTSQSGGSGPAGQSTGTVSSTSGSAERPRPTPYPAGGPTTVPPVGGNGMPTDVDLRDPIEPVLAPTIDPTLQPTPPATAYPGDAR